jgi:hypothetical protein
MLLGQRFKVDIQILGNEGIIVRRYYIKAIGNRSNIIAMYKWIENNF